MKKIWHAQFGIFNPRILFGCALCSVGALLAMFSLAATPSVEGTRTNTSVLPNAASFPGTLGSNTNRLPHGDAASSWHSIFSKWAGRSLKQ
jgi:hypothetical protein